MTFRHRQRNPRHNTIQLQARRGVEKAEIRVKVLAYGLSKVLKNFYGDSGEMGDILDIVGTDLYNASHALKWAEEDYKKITEITEITKKKTISKGLRITKRKGAK